MFFRREKPHQWTFEERLQSVKQFGIDSIPDGPTRAVLTRDGCGASVEDKGDGKVALGTAGLLRGGEIASLVSAGYQMLLRTPSGREFPATAADLKKLHAFVEDAREGLGLASLYNQALGTISADHLYDRLEERDAPHGPRPWERKAARP
jgi:hypothetical protein